MERGHVVQLINLDILEDLSGKLFAAVWQYNSHHHCHFHHHIYWNYGQ